MKKPQNSATILPAENFYLSPPVWNYFMEVIYYCILISTVFSSGAEVGVEEVREEGREREIYKIKGVIDGSTGW